MNGWMDGWMEDGWMSDNDGDEDLCGIFTPDTSLLKKTHKLYFTHSRVYPFKPSTHPLIHPFIY